MIYSAVVGSQFLSGPSVSEKAGEECLNGPSTYIVGEGVVGGEKVPSGYKTIYYKSRPSGNNNGPRGEGIPRGRLTLRGGAGGGDKEPRDRYNRYTYPDNNRWRSRSPSSYRQSDLREPPKARYSDHSRTGPSRGYNDGYY